MRKEINKIVRNWASKNGGCYQLAWNNVYKEFGKQNHRAGRNCLKYIAPGVMCYNARNAFFLQEK